MRLTKRPVPASIHWRAVTRLGVIFAAVALTPAGWPQQNPPQANSVGGGIFVDGHLSEEYTRPGQSIRFWISIENRSGSAITDIRLSELYVPGFAKKPWCAAQLATCEPAPGAGPECAAPSVPLKSGAPPAKPDEYLLCSQLGQGESIIVRGDLVAIAPEGQHNFYAVISWSSDLPAANAPRSSRAVALGDGEVLSGLGYWWRLLPSQPLYVIPIVVALLTILGTWLTKRLEQHALTWSSTMLVESHKATVQFYMPTGSHLTAAVGLLESYRSSFRAPGKAMLKRDLQTLQRAYFHMMMFQWWYWQTFLNESAFHLKNRMGEHLIQLLYGHHAGLFGINRLPIRRLLERILGHLKKEMTLDEFLVQLVRHRSDEARGWSLFQKWARREECDRDLVGLRGFLAVLLYEVNRPNLHWYGHLEALRLPDSLLVTLYDLVPARKWRTDVEEYFARARIVTKASWWSWVQKMYYWTGRPFRMARRYYWR